MNLQEQYFEDYAEGFNDASILATHAPEILSEIIQDNNPMTDYFQGFFEGKTHCQEQEQQKGLEELKSLRDRTHDRNKEKERE